MAKFVIKKRIGLEFLGELYKDAYLIFRSIPIKDYETILEGMPKDDKKPQDAYNYVLKILKEYFVSGQFPDEKDQLADVTVEDLDELLDAPTATNCFESLTGQDPKAEAPLNNPSTMEQPPQPNS